MATPKSIICQYSSADDLSFDVRFTDDGFFNATAAAKHFGKEPYEWVRSDSTKGYISELRDQTGVEEKQLVRTKAGNPENGGGTWLHPKLAVAFARWLDVRFAVWCDLQIDDILRGKSVVLGARAYREARSIIADVRAICKLAGVSDEMALAHGAEHALRATGVDITPILRICNTVDPMDRPMNLGELGALIGVTARRMGTLLTEHGLRTRNAQGDYVPTEKGKPYSTYNPFAATHDKVDANGEATFSQHSGYQLLWKRGVLDAISDPSKLEGCV